MDNAVNVEVDNSQVAAQTPVNNGNVATSVEVDNSQLSTQAVDNSVDNSQVINTATPMDTNRTYDNLSQEERTPAIGDHVSPLQGAIEDAMAIQRNRLMDQNAGSAMDNFLNNEYDYDRNEAGTYWVAGAINDNATQLKFLDAIVKEQMYDDLDLQKYYYDNTMATARAYAAAKNKEAAYKFYRAAQEKAITEASFTGWYMPAEGEYMLGQYTVAQTTLARDDATPEEINKAKDVIKTTEKWFNANQIGTRGIKCLSLLNFEERVRHNKEAERLQDQANKIAAASAGVSDELAKLQLREFKFRVEELELQTGRNFSKEIGLDDKDYFGHDINDPEYAKYSMLFGGQTLEEITKDPRIFEDVKTARGIQWLKSNLGDKYDETYKNYMVEKNTQMINSGQFDVDSMTSTTLELKDKTLSDGTVTDGKARIVYSRNTTTGEIEARVFVKDENGNVIQLDWGTVSGDNGALNHTYTEAEMASHKDKTKTQHIGGLDLKNGKRIGDYVKQEEFVPGSHVNDNGIREYDILYDEKGNPVATGVSSGSSILTDTSWENQNNRQQKVIDTIKEYTKQGYIEMPGYYADDKGTFNGQKQGIIMYNPKEDKYISIGTTGGSLFGVGLGEAHDISKEKIKSIPNKDYTKLSGSQQNSVRQQMQYIGKYNNNYGIFAYQDANNRTHYVGMVLNKESNEYGIGDLIASWNPIDLSRDDVIKAGYEKQITNFENNREAYNNRTQSTFDSNAYKLESRKTVDTTDLNLGNVSQADARKIISEGSNISSEERKALYEKYNVSESEAPKFDALHGESLVEALKDKSMNDVLESQIGG